MTVKLKSRQPAAAARSPKLRGALEHARERLRAGDHVGAALAYDACLVLSPGLCEALCGLGWCALMRGELDAAQRYALQATDANPADSSAWRLLGRVCKRLSQIAEAERCLQRALELSPDAAEARIDLGIVLRARGDLRGAADQYRAALRRRPDSFEATTNLANALADLGEVEQAIPLLRAAIAARPGVADPAVNLAKLLIRLRRLDEAEVLLAQALTQAPSDGKLLCELGALHEARADWTAAADAYHRAALLMPGDLQAHLLLGEVGLKLRAHDRCIAIYRRCLEIAPNDARATNNLSVVLRMQGQPGEALALARRAVELKPEMIEAHASLADALSALGRSNEADSVYRDTARRFPDHILTNLLLTSNYVDSVSPEELLARHRQMGERYAKLAPPAEPHRNDRDPQRQLRVGYLSGDFRAHSIAYFIEPIFRAHDRSRIQIAAYYTQGVNDAVTERLMQHTSIWVQAESLSDSELAARIREDEIDILVDLSGHTAGNRLFAVMRRPAPVQVAYLGYPTTWGLAMIDYRISDWEVDPAGSEALNSEAIVRLPHSYYCFGPVDAPVVAPPPAIERGWITFASFNNLSKLSDAAVSLWAAVLRAVPGSRLLLKTRGLSDAICREGLIGRFVADGIDAERLRFEAWTPTREGHLSQYNEVDIALDTFPYNGGTTTCEALWMGVPVISLSGATHASRMGRSLLTAAGLPELVASGSDEFVRIAAALAGDLPRLASLRARLREHLSGSPLMDATQVTRALEAAYRTMWQRWCAGA